ncbi:MAG: LPS export ABC transporter periplasmic protein LptC [Myxococcales bacterium]|nr:LPS export ABC transporter periplasmic protein LptC [Myxococcales bacterium]
MRQTLKHLRRLGLLAALVACTGCARGAGKPSHALHPPEDGDAVVTGARFLATDGRDVRYRANAARGAYREAERAVSLTDVHAKLFADGKPTYTLQAERGRILVDSNDMEFPGPVVASTSDGATLEGTDFRYDAAGQTVQSDHPVTVRRDAMRVEGAAFRAWPREERFELLGGVRGQVNQP